MRKNNLIIAWVVALCLLFSFTAVFAEPSGDTTKAETSEITEAVTAPSTEFQTQEQTEESTTQEDFEPSDYDTTEEITTEKKSDVSTTRKQNPTTTRRPTTTRSNRNEEQDNREEERTTSRSDNPVEMTEEEETLPEGAFYVYLERNNGTKRLKAVLTKPELVTEPETPIREGFFFDGWYADAEFTKKWNFYTDLAQEGTVIYAKWIADPSAVTYMVSIQQVSGGTIEVNPVEASQGEPVMIVVNPDEGMRLVAGSLTVNGKYTDILSFIMPAQDVVINAAFEAVPETEEKVEDEPNLIPFIVGGILLLVAVAIVVFLVLKRRDDFADDEIDENGTIIDNDTDMSWVDESIVVEDGFKDGEKIIGNFVPEADYEIESDDEE